MLIAFIIFAVLSLAYVVFQEDLKERKQKANAILQNELSEERTTEKFLEEKPFEPVGSVTENSTKLLFVEGKTRKLEWVWKNIKTEIAETRQMFKTRFMTKANWLKVLQISTLPTL